jgi:phosphoglycolate phosphatase
MGQKTFLFDLDGTLAESLPSVLKIMDIVVKEYKFKIDKRAVVDLLKSRGVKEVFKKFRIPFYRVPGLIKKYREEYRKEIPFLKPVVGIKETLGELKDKGIKLGIITTNGRDNVIQFLKANQLDIFDYIYADIGIFNKSKAIKKIIKLNKLDPGDTFFVGDETRDIEAAKKAGVKSIAVSWGYQTGAALQKEEPDYIFNYPDELLSIS